MANLFQIWNCDGGIIYDGTTYTFTDLDSVAWTYNKKNHLTRGANATNTRGIISQEGGKTPDTAEYSVVDCPKALYKLLLDLFEKKARLTAFFINRDTGEYMNFKDAVIRDKPRQTNVGEDDSSLSFIFAVESFNVSEKLNDEDDAS